MKRTAIVVAAGLAFAVTQPAAPAFATQIKRTYVSALGNDANVSTLCQPSAPCRTFGAAYSVTIADGEINVLDPAGYGTLTITHGLSIQGRGWASITAQSGNAITITAGPTDKIYLQGLLLDGAGAGANGIVFSTGQSLTIENCVIRNFTGDGIEIFSTGASGFAISNTTASDNGARGIYVAPHGSGAVQGAITGSATNNNFDGIALDGQFTTGAASTVTVVNCVAANNSDTGISAQKAGATLMAILVRDTNSSHNGFAGFVTTGGATMRLAHSVATGNSQGVSSTGTINTYGDNDINGNYSVDVNATFTSVSMR
jgi:hypothetical protein